MLWLFSDRPHRESEFRCRDLKSELQWITQIHSEHDVTQVG